MNTLDAAAGFNWRLSQRNADAIAGSKSIDNALYLVHPQGVKMKIASLRFSCARIQTSYRELSIRSPRVRDGAGARRGRRPRAERRGNCDILAAQSVQQFFTVRTESDSGREKIAKMLRSDSPLIQRKLNKFIIITDNK